MENKREIWIDWLRVAACLMAFIVTAVVSVLIRKIPVIGKYIV